jgi:D-alanine-D-alanine ligase
MSVLNVPKRHESIEIVVSTNRSLSSMGNVSREAIYDVLKTRYHNVRISGVNNQQDLEAMVSRKPDLAFLGMKFIPVNPVLGLHDPQKIWISRYLQDSGIRYTGSERGANKLEFNKQLAKQRVAAHGINTARHMTVRKGSKLNSQDVTLTYPLFVKPLDRGGGAGIDEGSLVHTFEQLHARVELLAVNLRADALIEEYLPGREFSVGILKDTQTDEYTALPIEIIPPQNTAGERFLSKSIKCADTEQTLEVTDPVLKAKINTLGLQSFHALGASNYGRIDVRLDANGEPHFLEANLLPSLIENYGNFPKACLLNLGLSHQDLIFQLVDLGLGTTIKIDELAEHNFVRSLLHDEIGNSMILELN